MKLIRTLRTALLLLLTSACNDGAPTTALPPSSTITTQQMIGSRSFAETLYYSTSSMAEMNYQLCEVRGDSDCPARYEQELAVSFFYLVSRANMLPERECGATVFLADSSANMEDSDGDLVSNYWEFKMYLNPCRQESTPGYKDGSLDYDADGILNAEDEYPICNNEESNPSGISDCI